MSLTASSGVVVVDRSLPVSDVGDGGYASEQFMQFCWRMRKSGRWNEYKRARDAYVEANPGKNRKDAAIALYEQYKPDAGEWRLEFPGMFRAVPGLSDGVAGPRVEVNPSPAMLSHWKKHPEAFKVRLERRRIELMNTLSDEPKLSYEELTTWVSLHVSDHDISMLKIMPPNRQAWSMLWWAREQPDKFWATFHSVKKKEVDAGVDSRRQIDLEAALSVVYKAAQDSVVDAAELDRETFGLEDLERARRTIAVAEHGAVDVEEE